LFSNRSNTKSTVKVDNIFFAYWLLPIANCCSNTKATVKVASIFFAFCLLPIVFWILGFEIWFLFGSWILRFGIYLDLGSWNLEFYVVIH